MQQVERDPMLDHFDLIAPLYERVIPPPDPAQWRELLRLPTDGWLLDAGGGTGRVSAQLRPLVGGLVVGDVARQMLQQTRTRPGLSPVLAYTEKLPFPAAYFDRVLVVDALHHFCSHQKSIDDLLRVLKPGGRLVIEEPDVTTLPVKAIALAEKLALMRSHFLTPAEICAIIERHGLRAKIEHKNRYEFWIIVDNV
jgi:demethylmenaquinone methyltransferase/2-methoxy-6-polyprenyl-1,4-benzoquinol methylase